MSGVRDVPAPPAMGGLSLASFPDKKRKEKKANLPGTVPLPATTTGAGAQRAPNRPINKRHARALASCTHPCPGRVQCSPTQAPTTIRASALRHCQLLSLLLHGRCQTDGPSEDASRAVRRLQRRRRGAEGKRAPPPPFPSRFVFVPFLPNKSFPKQKRGIRN